VRIAHGPSSPAEQLAARMIGLKGVQPGCLVMTSPQLTQDRSIFTVITNSREGSRECALAGRFGAERRLAH
jgi:hypothetical protein